MQEWFCLQFRCAGVSAETEGDKGTGRPISRAVLLPFFIPPRSSGYIDSIHLSRRRAVAKNLSARERLLRAGRETQSRATQFSRRQRERKEMEVGWEFRDFFFYPAGWVTAETAHLLCFFPLKMCSCRAGGEDPAVGIAGRSPPARCRDPRSGAGGVAGERGGRRGGGGQPFAAAGAWPCPGLGEESGQGLAGASGVQF